jgi:carbamoyl-phosphate synthase large subunit
MTIASQPAPLGRTASGLRRFVILVSSAGRRVALVAAARQALDDLGLDGAVVAVDASERAAALHAADEGVVVPPCCSPEFVPAMLEVCDRFGVDLIVPTIDPELPVYASCAGRFLEAGVTVAVSSLETVAMAADKSATNAWFLGKGFPTVRQGTIDEVLADPSDWPLPLVVKPRSGSAAIGVSVVHDMAEMELAGRRGELVVEHLARGAEFTVDVLVDRSGIAACAVPRRRLEVRAGEVSKAVTVRCPSLAELARGICEALPGAYGVLNVQIFADERTGELSALEINPRFGGGFPLTWRAGGRYLTWMIEEILGLPSTAAPDAWQPGLMMLRYDDAVFVTSEQT